MAGLSLRSERFRTQWARHEVRPPARPGQPLSHPQAGDLRLHSIKLAVDGTGGLTLVVFHAGPGSRRAAPPDVLGGPAVPAAGVAERRVGEP